MDAISHPDSRNPLTTGSPVDPRHSSGEDPPKTRTNGEIYAKLEEIETTQERRLNAAEGRLALIESKTRDHHDTLYGTKGLNDRVPVVESDQRTCPARNSWLHKSPLPGRGRGVVVSVLVCLRK